MSCGRISRQRNMKARLLPSAAGIDVMGEEKHDDKNYHRCGLAFNAFDGFVLWRLGLRGGLDRGGSDSCGGRIFNLDQSGASACGMAYLGGFDREHTVFSDAGSH